mgnify:CR=1 FL=1
MSAPNKNFDPVVPAALDPANLERAKLVPVTAAKLSAGLAPADMATDAFAKGWSKRLPAMVKLTQPGQSIEFRFKGTHCAVYDVVGPAGGAGAGGMSAQLRGTVRAHALDSAEHEERRASRWLLAATALTVGLALAWAVVEAVHGVNRCRCLFATHYHELARLADSCEALSLHHVRAREWKGDLVLLHEVAEGPADRSYGLAVAKLAGVPAPVVSRAKAVLERLEKGRAETGGLAAGLGDLPLFAAAAEARADLVDTLRERLKGLDVDALSPREALDLLYELKRDAGAEG